MPPTLFSPTAEHRDAREKAPRIVCVLPAYNVARTLARTLEAVPKGVIDRFVLVDDASTDDTLEVARGLTREFPLHVISHPRNLGYGANQKTCYREALRQQADVVVMLHPDFQYDPRLIGALCALVTSGVYDVALGSRISDGRALRGGMPLYKYLANRALTIVQNLLLGLHLSEYHTGYRAFSRRALETIELDANDDGFLFDNQILLQCHRADLRIGEMSVPAHYFPEASSLDLRGSVRYGMGVLGVSLRGAIARLSRATGLA